MRYFFISFISERKNIPGNGNATYLSKTFPSLNHLSKYITKDTGADIIIVTNIFEFKSKEDYNSFKGK